MSVKIKAIELGGTLFVPASHKDLEHILSGEKYPELRSVVIDFEDGLSSSARPEALKRLEVLLQELQETTLLRFVRPQDQQMLKALLEVEGIEKVDGFILPKFGLDNAEAYLSLLPLASTSLSWHIMPSIEGRELFDIQQLQQLRDRLLPYQEQIICLRFGAQDMLRQLGLRQTGSIYDMLVPHQVIANLIMTFRPYGFEISAPVYPDFSDAEGFQKELTYELRNGLVSKTIIHPRQIPLFNTCYKVDEQSLISAEKILEEEDGLLNLEGSMGERKTQSSWAKSIKRRAETYGIRL